MLHTWNNGRNGGLPKICREILIWFSLTSLLLLVLLGNLQAIPETDNIFRRLCKYRYLDTWDPWLCTQLLQHGPTTAGLRSERLFISIPFLKVDRNSSVGIATRYGLDGPGIESCPDRPWGPPNLLYNVYRVFPGGKAAGAWRWPPTPI
jgi:hypothetical protein